MSVAKFKVVARFDRAGGPVPGVLYVDRDAGLVGARPLRRRRTYELPLSAVADFVCRTVVLAELREGKRREG